MLSNINNNGKVYVIPMNNNHNNNTVQNTNPIQFIITTTNTNPNHHNQNNHNYNHGMDNAQHMQITQTTTMNPTIHDLAALLSSTSNVNNNRSNI